VSQFDLEEKGFLKKYAGAHKGQAVDPEYYRKILDAYYAHYGWTPDGLVPEGKFRGL
jgi:hypothetical protein